MIRRRNSSQLSLERLMQADPLEFGNLAVLRGDAPNTFSSPIRDEMGKRKRNGSVIRVEMNGRCSHLLHRFL